MNTESLPGSTAPAKPKSSSKTIWIVVIVVLFVVGLPLCACGGCFATVFFGVAGMIKGSEPYLTSLERVVENEQVRERLGEPIEPGLGFSGSINLDNDAGECDISYGVSGPNGSGTVVVRGTRSGGVWTYDEMSVNIDGETIDLRP